MNCPHCDKSLLYQQRRDGRCSHCGKRFVFEPRRNRMRLHDVKLRRLADKLSDGGRLSYTVTQLWYAAAQAPTARRAKTVPGHAKPTRFPRLRTPKPVPPKLAAMPLETFRELVLWTWSDVYDAWPNGVVDETAVTVRTPERTRLALLCPDRAVLACLRANGVPDTFEMALTPYLSDVPPGVPVVVLHDASPAGCAFAARARAELSGRTVTVAGLRPRTVLRWRRRFLRLRWPAKPRGLAGLELDPEEMEWLTQRWWSPIAAVRPKQLLAAVTKAVERVGAADPDWRRARRVGFLTWPPP